MPQQKIVWSETAQKFYHVIMADGVKVEFHGRRYEEKFIVEEPDFASTKHLVLKKGLSRALYLDADENDPMARKPWGGTYIARVSHRKMVFEIKEVAPKLVPFLFTRAVQGKIPYGWA